MEPAADWILGCTLGAHLILTALYQFPRLAEQWFARLAIPFALPCWTFFAPRPGTSDYRLLSRVSNGLDDSAWCEVDLGWRQGCLARAFWNPEKIGQKVLADCVQSLTRIAVDLPERDRSAQFASKPYLTILSYLIDRAELSNDCRIEFTVLESKGFGRQRVVTPIFISQRHKVSR